MAAAYKRTIKHRMQEAVDFLYAIPKFTKKNPLAHTEKFMERLGNPQDSLKVIHVAGSNGKGSVCSFLFSILRECGCSVGMFTSPHLVDIRERFVIHGGKDSDRDTTDGMPGEEVFLKAYDDVLKLANQMQEEGDSFPTFFEFLFAMGMLIFQRSGVEYVILETGMGGRLDATNIVKRPLVCVITSVSLEHTEYLGDTIEAIAFEKAGIIKPGVPVVYDGNDKVVSQVIKNRADELGSDSYEITKNMCKFHETIGGGIDFSFASHYDKETDFHLSSSAPYQVMNAALAITAFYRIAKFMPGPASERSDAAGAERLAVQQSEWQKSEEQFIERAVKTGIAKASWPGRMQQVMPDVYFDGAHNPDGIRAFLAAANLLTRQDEKKPLLLFSMVRDKDYHQAVKELLTQVKWEKICVTGIPSERGLTVEELQSVFEKVCTGTLFYGAAEEKREYDDTSLCSAAEEKREYDGLSFCGAAEEKIEHDDTSLCGAAEEKREYDGLSFCGAAEEIKAYTDTPFCGVRDYREAFRQMLEKKQRGQKLFVTGSLYFIGALLKEIQDAEF